MSRQKKSRKVSDIMPARKSDQKVSQPKSLGKNQKTTRYELDLQAKNLKKKRKHKGLPSGSRNNEITSQHKEKDKEQRDPRLGSRKKIPLMVEFINQPEKGKIIPPMPKQNPSLSAEEELWQLENNECLNQLLDQLEQGNHLSSNDQAFVDLCLARIEVLMSALGIKDEDEEDSEYLLRQFETININQFR